MPEAKSASVLSSASTFSQTSFFKFWLAMGATQLIEGLVESTMKLWVLLQESESSSSAMT